MVVGREDPDVVAARVSRRSPRHRSPPAPRGRGPRPGLPKAICRLLRQSTSSQRLAWSRSWVAMTMPRPSAASSVRSGPRGSGRRARRGRRRARPTAAGARPGRGPGRSAPVAAVPRRDRRTCPAARPATPTRSSAARAASRSPCPGRLHQGRRGRAPIRATSSAETGKSSRERSVCGTDAALPSTSTVPRIGRSSPSRTRSRVVLPPPFGPSSATRRPESTAKVTSSIAGTRP